MIRNGCCRSNSLPVGQPSLEVVRSGSPHPWPPLGWLTGHPNPYKQTTQNNKPARPTATKEEALKATPKNSNQYKQKTTISYENSTGQQEPSSS